MKKPSFNVGRLIQGGRVKHLHDLLIKRYHADPDPQARARADIDRIFEGAFAHFSAHFAGAKNSSLAALADLQRRAFDFYDEVLRSRGTVDVAKLDAILRDMDVEMDKLSRGADEMADVMPRPDRIALTPPPPKAWDDPTLTFDEFVGQYRARYPDSPLAWDLPQLQKHFDAKQRLNPDTGALRTPVVPRPPPLHVNLPTDPARVKAWNDYQRGGFDPPCFPVGTLVHTPAGMVPIEKLEAGDHVIAWNERTEELGRRAVLRTFRNWAAELVVLSTDGGSIVTTRRHRFWSEDERAWVASATLAPGARLRSLAGSAVAVTAVDLVLAHEATYNLEVADHHTYFVEPVGVLVHNQDSGFEVRKGESIQIYVVKDRAGAVVYVGQTVHGDVWVRLYEHINDRDSALYDQIPDRLEGKRIQVTDPENPFTIERVAASTRADNPNRRWTPYEAAVWEQYFIDLYGGPQKYGGPLLNRQNAITNDSFILYRNMHNPC